MYSISDKCVVGEVGSYCQLVVTLSFFSLTLPNQTTYIVSQFILSSPFHKSGSSPGLNITCSVMSGLFYL